MWQYPKRFVSGHRDRSLNEPAEFGTVGDSSQSLGWSHRVASTGHSCSVCIECLPDPMAENTRGLWWNSPSVWEMFGPCKNTNAFSQPLHLPFICFALPVCADRWSPCVPKAFAEFTAVWIFWETVGCSHGQGPLPLKDDTSARRCALAHLMWYTAIRIWGGGNGPPILSLEKTQAVSWDWTWWVQSSFFSGNVALISQLLGKSRQEDHSFEGYWRL